MTTPNDQFMLPADEVTGSTISGILGGAQISSVINEEDSNLVFVSYDDYEFENADINPVLSMYCDKDSNFIRFSLMNSAPSYVSKENVNLFVENLNKNYIVGSYEATNSDQSIFINCEYWLNFKFGLNFLEVFHIIRTLPYILSYSYDAEADNFN